MTNFAPDGVEFEDVEQQLIVRRSFRGRYRAFCLFAAQPVILKNLHTPRRFLARGRRTMRKRPNGSTKAIENGLVVVAAIRRGSR
jgi:hypothetical protein